MSLDFDKQPWTNWARNKSLTPWAHCYPKTLDDLVGFVTMAEKEGKRVRAAGSGWSFADVAMTSDYFVETNRLCNILSTVIPGALNNSAQGRNLLHVEAGITIENLNNILDAKNWALPTMGGASGQTLAGAVSTCVHGADLKWGPLPEMVRAIHLVGPGGVQYWIEPAQGITDAGQVQNALGLDAANIHYDDAWFNAVLVSVGSMGIIYSLLIELQDQFDLVSTCTHDTWNNMRQLLSGESLFSPSNRCVQVVIDPNLVNGSHACYLTIRQQAPPSKPLPPGDVSVGMGLFCQKQILETLMALSPVLFPGAELAIAALLAGGDGAVGDFLGSVLNPDPGLAAQLTSTLTSQMQPAGATRGWSHTVLAGPNQCVARGLGLEIAFDATNGSHLSFTDEALLILETALQQGLALGGWLSLRFVGRSRAYLSPQRFARTCMIEATGLRTLKGTAEILNRLELAGRRHGGIQHWGMFSAPNLSAADVASSYPDLKTWREIRWQVTNEGTLHTFDNDFSLRCGLISVEPTGPPVTWQSLQGTGLRPTPALGKNAGGRQDVFVLDTTGQLWHQTENTPGGTWSGWQSLGGHDLAGPIAVSNNADGRLQVFARGGDSIIYYRTQLAPDGAWADWSSLGGTGVKGFSVGRNADGRLELVAVWSDGALHDIWQTAPNGGWSNWASLGGSGLQGPVLLGKNADGRLDAFAISGNDGAVYHQWQAAPGRGPWSGWASLAHPALPGIADIALGSGTNGRLCLFLMRVDQALSYRAQVAPNGDWGAPVDLHGHDRLWPLAVGQNPDDRLEVFVIGGDHQLHNRKQIDRAHPDSWSSWATLGGHDLQAGIGIGASSTDDLELYAIGGDAKLYRGLRAGANQTVPVTVQVSSIVDHIQGTPQQLSLLHTFPRVKIGDDNYVDAVDKQNWTFKNTTVLRDMIPVHIEVWRSVDRVLGTVKKNIKGKWIIDYGKVGIVPLPPEFDGVPDDQKANIKPVYPGPGGVDTTKPAHTVVMSYSHDLKAISGDVSGKAATAIHIPNGPDSVEFDFAISER